MTIQKIVTFFINEILLTSITIFVILTELMSALLSVRIRYADHSHDETFFVSQGDRSNEEILEEIFSQYLTGSGLEISSVRNGECRSMATKDFVSIVGTWYQCESIGWGNVSEKYVADWFTELDSRVAKSKQPDLYIARWMEAQKMEYEKVSSN